MTFGPGNGCGKKENAARFRNDFVGWIDVA